MTQSEPARVRLTEDFVDLPIGMAYPAGTVLVRSTLSGQYMIEGTKLGQECVAGFFLIRDIAESIDS